MVYDGARPGGERPSRAASESGIVIECAVLIQFSREVTMKTARILALSLLAAALIALSAYCQKAEGPGARESAGAETVGGRAPLTLGERFHAQTCLTPAGALAEQAATRPAMPDRFKTYPGARVVRLPGPDHKGLGVEDAMTRRRSVRSYTSAPITLSQLSQLLFSAQGVTGSRGGQSTRTAPSAGALYPCEVYAVVARVKDLPQGLYHYAVREHALELVREGDFSGEISEAGLSQKSLEDAAVVIILTAVFDRARSKYGERGFRYVYMEAGHIAQNLCLEVASLGLGSVTVGAFADEEVNRLVGIDGAGEAAIYLHPVGAM
jgi:SagB-type dehydrogenase family enzyme